jgi:hypothetical protein
VTQQPTVKPSIVTELSDYELSFVLRFLQVPRLAGFEPLQLDEKTASVVEASLRARELTQITPEGQYGVVPALGLLLGACLQAQMMLLIAENNPQVGVHAHWIYFTPSLYVYHVASRAGVQRFQGIAENATLMFTIAQILGINPNDDKAPDGGPLEIAHGDWDGIVELMRNNDQAGLRAALNVDGVPPSLGQTLLSQGKRYGLNLSQRMADKVNEATMAAFQAPTGYWVLMPHGQDLMLQPLHGRALLAAVGQFMKDHIK